MSDYQGTAGPDTINQVTLGLPDQTVIYGGAGDDTITLAIGSALARRTRRRTCRPSASSACRRTDCTTPDRRGWPAKATPTADFCRETSIRIRELA
jgi:hypothetical protein